MQTIAGYYHYELLQYAKELYIVTFPQVLTFALFAMFVQTIVSNKFIGHGIVIGIFVMQPVLFNFGWENTLYLFGATPPYTYSDMNGYGHFVQPLFWSITLLVFVRSFSRRPLHRSRAPGRGGFAAGTVAPTPPECAWTCSSRRGLFVDDHWQRRLVLLQHACLE